MNDQSPHSSESERPVVTGGSEDQSFLGAPPYQYVVVHHADRAGVLAVQAVHAATECLRSLPVSDQTRVIVLVANTAAALEMLHVSLDKAGIHHSVIREDKAPYKGVVTAIGIEPQARDRVQPHVADFKVLR